MEDADLDLPPGGILPQVYRLARLRPGGNSGQLAPCQGGEQSGLTAAAAPGDQQVPLPAAAERIPDTVFG